MLLRCLYVDEFGNIIIKYLQFGCYLKKQTTNDANI